MSETETFAAEPEGVVIEAQEGAEPNPAEHSLDAAIDKAFKTAEAREKAKAAKAKEKAEPTEKDAQDGKGGKQDKEIDDALKAAEDKLRGEGGKRLPHDDPPSRFNEHAKAEWASLPEQTRAEVHRALRENEAGIQKYKERAESFAEVEDFHGMAKQHGTSLRQALTQYTTLEMSLTGNDPWRKLAGLQEVCRHMGTDMYGLAQAIVALRPEDRQQLQGIMQQQQLQQAQQQQAQQNADMQRQIAETQLIAGIAAFAAQHQDFAELEDDIHQEITSGGAASLEDAYQKAKRRKGSKDAGFKSISGAPAGDRVLTGSRMAKAKSIDEALDSAFARLNA